MTFYAIERFPDRDAVNVHIFHNGQTAVFESNHQGTYTIFAMLEGNTGVPVGVIPNNEFVRFQYYYTDGGYVRQEIPGGLLAITQVDLHTFNRRMITYEERSMPTFTREWWQPEEPPKKKIKRNLPDWF